jgi:LacI family transcriptional regulator/LacI family repressor for deo operon, udp, cdd, tsx, nupC, and nupG
MAVTIKQVAQLADVSPATVSYVLNGTGTVTETTRRRVLQAVEALGYQPHYAARSMRGRSHTLGLVMAPAVDRLADMGYAEMLSGLAAAASQRGYYLLLATAQAAADEVDLCRRLAQTGRVDGIVLFDMQIDDMRARTLADAGVPYVCAGRAPDETPSVEIDGHAGARLAVEHLLSLGHTRIGLIQLPSELTDSAVRFDGYVDALRAAGIELDPELVVEAGRRENDGYHATLELLERPEPPTAILACSDDLAFGALHAIHEAGLSVGQEVSLVGFDDVPLAAHVQPPLTTLRQPHRAVGEQLAAMLIDIVEQRSRHSRRILLTPRLVVRHSAGPVPAQSRAS